MTTSRFTLFYPSSGHDILPVIHYFKKPGSYWFVDIHKFTTIPDYLICLPDYTHVFSKIINVELPEFDRYTTTILHHRLTYNDGKKQIEINLVQGDGFTSFLFYFMHPQQKLDVFFYRGDGMGEGGSGFSWFKKQNFRIVLKSLTHNNQPGAVITDGSNYTDFHKLHDLNREETMLSFMHSPYYIEHYSFDFYKVLEVYPLNRKKIGAWQVNKLLP